MNRIIKKTSVTDEAKLADLLEQTVRENDCMLWTRCLNTDGYPHMFGNVKVHRLVHKLSYKENIDGKVIRHTCDNIRCLNPEHLISGTPVDNVKDMDERGRRYKVITKDIVVKVKAMLKLNLLTQKEIAKAVNIDLRRVSDINCGKYTDDGKFLRR